MTKIYFLLREQITTIIRNSGLNIGAVYYILKDILRDIELQYISQVNKEFAEETSDDNKAEDIEEQPNQ